jgi:hypothetical protein
VFAATFIVEQSPPAQTGTTHTLPVAGQSLAATRQTAPPELELVIAPVLELVAALELLTALELLAELLLELVIPPVPPVPAVAPPVPAVAPPVPAVAPPVPAAAPPVPAVAPPVPEVGPLVVAPPAPPVPVPVAAPMVLRSMVETSSHAAMLETSARRLGTRR